MKILIEIQDGNIVKKHILNKRIYLIGRENENDIVLNDNKVSRFHAVLIEEGNNYCLVDKESFNHTYVNGEQIESRILESQDFIGISKDITLLYLNVDDALCDSCESSWKVLHPRFASLKEVTKRIISVDSLDNILQAIIEEAVAVVRAERGFICLIDEAGKLQEDSRITYHILDQDKDFSFSRSIVQEAISKRDNVFLPRIVEEFAKNSSIHDLKLDSVMCAPLLFGQRLVGVLYVDARYELCNFSKVDRFLFSMLADHASIAIENAKLFRQIKMSLEQLGIEITESEERYRQVVEISPDAIFVQSNGKIIFANEAAIKMVNAQTVEQIFSSSLVDLIRFNTSEIKISRERFGPEEGELIPFQSLSDSVDHISVEVTGSSLKYRGVPSILMVARDVTERKKFEQEAMKTEKLKSLGILAGGIAHDFNNILMGVVGNISLAKEKIEQKSEAFEILDKAEKISHQARHLTLQLLTFAKGGAPVKQHSSLVEILKDSVGFYLRGSKVKCEFYIADDLAHAEIDPGQISQVLNNLLINATQAMPNGGVIELIAENVEISGECNSLTLREGRYIKISVADNGNGIPTEKLDKIFDPYFTTKKTGSGLGLTICYSIIKNHGGHIEVESKNDGATFHIYLPAVDGKKTTTSLKRKIKQLPLYTGKILVMDDEDFIRRLVGRMLKHLNYEAEFACDGNEAIEKYKRSLQEQSPFAAVIIDLTIKGGMGGKDTIEHLLKIDPKVRAIVSSGYSNDPILAKHKQYGFHGLICKPYKINKLQEVLAEVLVANKNESEKLF